MEVEKEVTEYRNGTRSVTYHKKGNPLCWHNEEGPARITYDTHGRVTIALYYINDIQITEEQWKKEYGWKLLLKGSPMGEIYTNNA